MRRGWEGQFLKLGAGCAARRYSKSFCVERVVIWSPGSRFWGRSCASQGLFRGVVVSDIELGGVARGHLSAGMLPCEVGGLEGADYGRCNQVTRK